METYYGEIEQARSRIARERALADFQTLACDTEALIKATAHDASETARSARARLVTSLDQAKATAIDLQEQALVAARRADTFIRGHPYHFAGTAFGVGLLIGVLAVTRGRPEET